jgi:hypothetical protein
MAFLISGSFISSLVTCWTVVSATGIPFSGMIQ